MVDINALDRLYPLIAEARAITAGLDNLDHGGMIISMTIGGAPVAAPMVMPMAPPGDVPMPAPPLPSMPVLVSTAGITYPPAMVEAIKTALKARQTEIMNELAKAGLS